MEPKAKNTGIDVHLLALAVRIVATITAQGGSDAERIASVYGELTAYGSIRLHE